MRVDSGQRVVDLFPPGQQGDNCRDGAAGTEFCETPPKSRPTSVVVMANIKRTGGLNEFSERLATSRSNLGLRLSSHDWNLGSLRVD